MRQVVVLQVTNADQSIHAQTMFYGSPLAPTERPNNARGISVWPAWTSFIGRWTSRRRNP